MMQKPEWLRVRPPGGPAYVKIKETLRSRSLYTVCEEARCPNVAECWATGTATFMLLGDVCTRACGFCSVKTGNPLAWVDPEEPQKLTEALSLMKLKYAVITTVDRDDLPDGGAAHLAKCLKTVRNNLESPPIIEMLVGDFRGQRSSLATLCEASPDVFAHNTETVPRLTPRVRDRRASFDQSLRVLESAKHDFHLYTKSSLMLGLGETEEEVLDTLQSLKQAGVSVITLGQYLQPTSRHLPVTRYVTPEEFQKYREAGLSIGFDFVASGPLVRSSYRAAEQYIHRKIKENSL